MTAWPQATNAVTDAMEEEWFVVHGVKVLVAVPNSVMGNHIESDARGVMQVEGEYVTRVMVMGV